ncbi:uncharacterized protein LOC125649763 isoform X3 [Ostrea edulis]|uniref:uncharacterized protein LOC125649763 isoform X3 n=1 Tax=Ostrea edulis TaxID=37623 RepID=UPI0024AFE323|nr:uncharacterized protein LOC125649763 isoform X3 [Ostrea edulis]
MSISLFGETVESPFKNGTSSEGKDSRWWNCHLTLQVWDGNRLCNERIVKKLQHQNGIILGAVCRWASSQYDGVLQSIKCENNCLKFSFGIFSKRKYENFCQSFRKNEMELQRILLDKEVLEYRNAYCIRLLQCQTSCNHCVTEDNGWQDGNESDDSALSSLGQVECRSTEEDISTYSEECKNSCQHRIEEIMHVGLKEVKESIMQILNDNFKSVTQNMHGEYIGLRRQLEMLNEDMKRIDARSEQMSSGRFQHVFQKAELLRRQEEETYSKIVQLESTTTETNALVYELHQKVDSLKNAVQRASEIHKEESKDMSSEYTRIKEQIAVINGQLDVQDKSFDLKSWAQNPSSDTFTLKSQDNLFNSKESDLVDSTSGQVDGSTSDLLMTAKSSEVMRQEAVSEVMFQRETKETGRSSIGVLSACEYNDMIYPFCPEEHGIKREESNKRFSVESNRSLSPTLEKAIKEYDSDILGSDDEEETESLAGMITESTAPEDSGVTHSYHTSIDTDGNVKFDNGKFFKSGCTVTQFVEVTPEDDKSSKYSQPEELTRYLKQPDSTKHDAIQICGSTTGNNAGEEIHHSECDTDVEETLQVSGLPKSRPVVRAVKQALKVNMEESRLHGLDTMLCVDVSVSMTDKVFQQVQSTIFSFLDVVEEVAIDDRLEENIGLVMFGRETKISVQLTNDYSKLRHAVENLSLGGTSPLHTALSLCRLELQRNGQATRIYEHCIAPRIILFTDGRVTRDSQMDELDSEYAPKDPQKFDEISSFVQQMGNDGYQLFTIGTGRQSNKEFLEKLANLGGGMHFELENVSFLANYFRYQCIVGRVIHKCRESVDDPWSVDYKSQLQHLLQTQLYRLNQDDIDQLEELLRWSEELEDVEYPGLPKLGSRVKTVSGDVGTIVKHRKHTYYVYLINLRYWEHRST